jgi:DinB family protein
MDQRALLAIVEDSWRRLDAAVAGMDDAALSEPGVVGEWSVKDLLGHVATWDQRAIEHIERWLRGEPPALTGVSTDDFNAREAARRHGWTPTQVRADAAETRQRLRAALASIGDAEWATVITVDGRRRPAGEWIGGTLSGDEGPGSHAAEHAAEIRAWRDARCC